jgi:hypothetical protein
MDENDRIQRRPVSMFREDEKRKGCDSRYGFKKVRHDICQ